MAQLLRVLIVADDPLARTGLAALLTGHDACLVVGQVAGDDQPDRALLAYRPDVLLWDLGWDPGRVPAGSLISGVERLAELADEGPPVIALLPDPTYAAGAWAAGARGLLSREMDATQIVAALLAAAEGLTVIDPTFMPVAFAPAAQGSSPLVEDLTPREREVLQRLAEGLPNKAIAHHLNISEHTVKFHVNAILGKLGAQSRTEAVVRATRLGLISL